MIIDKLKGHFRKTTVTRRKEHIFLGINIKYHTDNCTAVVSIKSYLQQAIDECGLEIRREASTPARCTFSRWIKDLLFLKMARPRCFIELWQSFSTWRFRRGWTFCWPLVSCAPGWRESQSRIRACCDGCWNTLKAPMSSSTLSELIAWGSCRLW